jgi:hypothetical protein
MRTKINWGFVFIAWLMIEMLGIILITPGPVASLAIEAMEWMR